MKTLKTVRDILKAHGVKSYKQTDSGAVAIHKKTFGVMMWLYFGYYFGEWKLSGTTRYFEKD